MTRQLLHRARSEPWSPSELKAQLCDVVDGLASHRGRDVSPLDVALELLGGELEAFTLFGRVGHLDPPRADGEVPIAILRRRSGDPEVEAKLRACAKKWALEEEQRP